MRVAMGGTFDVLHAGHEALLDAAFALGGEVFIGLTTDAMALQGRGKVSPYTLRKQRLEAWLKKRGYKGWTIGPLEDPYGPAVSEPFDAIVVSEDREGVAKALNEERTRRGLPPLAIHVVPMVLAEDDAPIASRRIRAKEIDRKGTLLRPLRVKAGKTVGDAMAEITGDAKIGQTTGAIGFLTEGRMDRTRLTEAAVLMAMVPRIRKDLYRGGVRPATK